MGKGYNNAPASNTAATFTISDGLGENGVIELEQLYWSLDVAPAAGVNLKVESPSGTIIFQCDVSTQGVGFIPFSGSCLAGARGQNVIVTLAAAGSGITGKVGAIRRMDLQGIPMNRPSGI